MVTGVLPYGLAPLLAGVAFLVVGMLLIGHAVAARGAAIRRRVDAVALPAPSMAPRAEVTRRRYGWGSAENQEIVRLFARLGVSGRYAVALMSAIRIGLGIAVGAMLIAFARHHPLLARPVLLPCFAVIGICLGWFVPGMAIGRRVARRAAAVEGGLPEAVELLVVCVEAGLALDAAFDRVVSELRGPQPALAEELAETAADLKILPSREAAFARLAQRIDAPSVHMIVATLSQTMRYGTPLAHALRAISNDLRNQAITRLEERANRLPVLLTVPMTLFLLPAIFLVVGGPAFLVLMDQLFR